MTGKLRLFFVLVVLVALVLAACAQQAATQMSPTAVVQKLPTAMPQKPPTTVAQKAPAPTSAIMPTCDVKSPQSPVSGPTPTPQIVQFKQESKPALTMTIILPWQGVERLITEVLPYSPPGPSEQDKVKLIRAIINVEVTDLAKTCSVSTFDPPMSLVVGYDAADADAADGATNLILGYYGKWWKPIPGTTVIKSSNGGGTGTIQVKEWGDRHICWSTKP